ncbi:major facilitator superfamily transporter [Fusarium beomiforme]|uniref:Major facilitator superfamily transporter n=1 Tax=Fusarium beomiforme TaxID=44412 RepID=A0A9P5AL13_9HYPO|nr:major facilitator superfamily transporter [Fusarium beomiforme]
MTTYKNQSDSEQTVMPPEPPAVEPLKPARRWWHWHEPGTRKEEKWLIFKLDAAILTYTCLTFFVKYLDQTNITNAYVSGMKEDLNLRGNELNWLKTYFNIGIIIGAPFSTMMLTFIKPRWWLPACTLAWSLLVLGMHKAEAVKPLYILRFFTGLCESGAMPGSFYIIGSWYRSFMELTCGVNLQRWMTLCIKSLRVDGKPKYSTEKVNAIPTAVGCTGLVWMLLSAFVADNYQNRALPICILGFVQLFNYIVLLVWPSSEAFLMTAYYLASAYSALSPLISAWLNSSCGGKKQLRALTTGLMIAIGYAVETVAQQEMFPVSQAPRFKQTNGYAFGIAWIVVMIA